VSLPTYYGNVSGGTISGTTGTFSSVVAAASLTLGTPLAVIYGGTGTTSPALTAGTGISLSGSWPNYTISATSSGTVTSVTASSPLASSGGTTPNISFTGILGVSNGGTGTSSPSLVSGTNTSVSGTWPAQAVNVTSFPASSLTGSVSLTTQVSGILPVANGGSGTSTPSLVAGSNVTITGSWPNQTINATAAPTTYTRTTFTATSGQTSFTVTYTVGSVQVYLNGVFLATTDYTATSGTAIVLATGANTGDIVDVVSLGTLSGSINLATQVIGTLAIANGGTGQTSGTAAFNALSPITSTGDLIIGNGTNSATRLAIGANTYVLTSNGTTATWAAPSTTNSLTINSSGTGGASPQSFNGSSAVTISYNTVGASPLAGSTSLTTVGTITTGTWNAGSVTTSGSFVAGSSTYGSTSASVNGSLTAQAVLYSNGSSSPLEVYDAGSNVLGFRSGPSSSYTYATFDASNNWNLLNGGSFKTGSSTYGPTSATVNGTLTATNLETTSTGTTAYAPVVLNSGGSEWSSGTGKLKVVMGTGTAGTSGSTITLTGNSVFTSSSSYVVHCIVNAASGSTAFTLAVNQNSGSQFTVYTASGTEAFSYMAIGY
jgi:trimeric autotransporter adhesin